jgi:tetratricopeptide (TPR) repeat protein
LVSGKLEESISSYDTSLIIKHDQASAYNNRGYAKFLLERYEEAIEDYTHAIEFNSSFVQARINRALAYNKLGYVNAALDDYNTIKLERPDLTRAINSMTQAY